MWDLLKHTSWRLKKKRVPLSLDPKCAQMFEEKTVNQFLKLPGKITWSCLIQSQECFPLAYVRIVVLICRLCRERLHLRWRQRCVTGNPFNAASGFSWRWCIQSPTQSLETSVLPSLNGIKVSFPAELLSLENIAPSSQPWAASDHYLLSCIQLWDPCIHFWCSSGHCPGAPCQILLF